MLDQPQRLSLDDLSSFGIDDVHGFLPGDDPLRELPPVFAPWEEAAQRLPKLILSGRLRRTLDGLPQLSAAGLEGDAALRRAMMLLSYFGHGYIWCGDEPARRLPATIAVPWFHVAARLGRPPVLSYASYALDNWTRIDRKRPVALDNLMIRQNFLGGADEDWFILIHIEIEARAAQAIRAVPAALAAAAGRDAERLTAALERIEAGLAAMTKTLRRMPEYCDPHIYYRRVRPYIHGWKDNPAVPDGVIYDGVYAYGDAPQKFRGETGAQSSIIPAIDAALGVVHRQDDLRSYLMEMRDYMPPGHRAFVEAVERHAKVRQFVTTDGAGNRALAAIYDACLRRVEEFRSVHLEYAARYIARQAQAADTNPTGVGTGGTPFMPYLKKHRDETGAGLLNDG